MKRRTDLLLLATLLAALVALFSRAEPAAAGAGLMERGLRPLAETEDVPERLRPPGAFEGDGGPSPVIFPEQDLTIRFDHKKHVKGLGISCTTCHPAAKTSTQSADSILPPATRCDACHGTNHRDLSAVRSDETRPMGQCGFCHTGYDPARPNLVARLLLPKPNLRFDHARHVSQEKIACAKCHGAVEELELATRDQLPRMKQCFTCHTGSSVTPRTKLSSTKSAAKATPSRACVTCHLTEPSGLLKTTFASGKMSPPPWLHDSGHGSDWIERHKRIAGDDSKFCASCHQERFCVGCHDGNVRPRSVHPNDFISQHPVAARQNNPRCTSCHQQQSFCLTCHQRVGVTLSGSLANLAGRGRFHPPKSLWTDGLRGPQHHAWEAQRNLNACVSCHQERDCAMCHATRDVGGPGSQLAPGLGRGVNPHPPGFRSRCRQALRQNARPCLTCHDPSAGVFAECR